MKKLVRILSLSMMLSGIGMILMPVLAEAQCCWIPPGVMCCGECCEASSEMGCWAGPCPKDRVQ